MPAINLKEHIPIAARSPYFINCVPSEGESITSATLVVTIQRGSRNAAVTSMTDIKTYTVTKTDAIDGIIVFDIAQLIRDYIDQSYIEFTSGGVETAPIGNIYFVKVAKTVVDTAGTVNTTDYYTFKDGYGTFKDGANFLPTTGATGNYPFPTAVAYDTDVTIMATNCYRQLGENSYGLVGIFAGQFEHLHPSTDSYFRVKFGSGDTWRTSFANQTNVTQFKISNPNDIADRMDNVEQALLYYPIGKKTMSSGWKDGFNYLRVGHFVKASDIGGTSTGLTSQEWFVNDGSIVDNGSGTVSFTVTTTPLTSITTVDILADPCGLFTGNLDEVFDVVSVVGNTITVSATDQAFYDHLACAVNAGNVYIEITYGYATGTDLIASINNQPVIRYEILCEPKYNVIDCYFINKWGAWDCFSFLKKSVENINTSSSQYKASLGAVTGSAYGYSTTDHQVKQYNKNGTKQITVNTGFIDESFNLLLEEIMMSESIYLIIDDVVQPVNLSTNGVEYKTSVNDKTINYTLTFEFAYDLINNVI